jgi:hypothetical protein
MYLSILQGKWVKDFFSVVWSMVWRNEFNRERMTEERRKSEAARKSLLEVSPKVSPSPPMVAVIHEFAAPVIEDIDSPSRQSSKNHVEEGAPFEYDDPEGPPLGLSFNANRISSMRSERGHNSASSLRSSAFTTQSSAPFVSSMSSNERFRASEEVTFIDLKPGKFFRIRELFGIDTNHYMSEWENGVKVKLNEGGT